MERLAVVNRNTVALGVDDRGVIKMKYPAQVGRNWANCPLTDGRSKEDEGGDLLVFAGSEMGLG